MNHPFDCQTTTLLACVVAALCWLCAPPATAATQSQSTTWEQSAAAASNASEYSGGTIYWNPISAWTLGSGVDPTWTHIWDGWGDEESGQWFGMGWDDIDPIDLFRVTPPWLDWDSFPHPHGGSHPSPGPHGGFDEFCDISLQLDHPNHGDDWMAFCPPVDGSGWTDFGSPWCDFDPDCLDPFWPPGWHDPSGGSGQWQNDGWSHYDDCWWLQLDDGWWQHGGGYGHDSDCQDWCHFDWCYGGWDGKDGHHHDGHHSDGHHYQDHNKCPPVPEPASMVLLGLGAAVLLAGKFRRRLLNSAAWQGLCG